MTTRAKVLTFDIERRPRIVFEWDKTDSYTSKDKEIIRSSTICYAAKWYDSDETMFGSIGHGNYMWRQPEQTPGYRKMLQSLADLLDEADIVVGYNSANFDEKKVRGELVRMGLREPSPFRTLDLIRTTRRMGWDYNSLAETAEALGLPGKTQHTGFQLWRDCLVGDADAWALMEEYNRQDVMLTEQVMDRFRPYIKDHPNLGLWADTDQHGDQLRVCPKCAGELRLVPGRDAGTAQSRYALHECMSCGARDTRMTVLHARVHTRTSR